MPGTGTLTPALPRAHYVDDASWRLERERVLLNSWTCMGRLDELGLADRMTGLLTPNRAAVVDLLGESVIVTVSDEGTLHAHYNVCRHRGTQLIPHDAGNEPAPAPCDLKVLRCPYHSWSYRLDGRLRKAPLAGDIDPDLFSLHPVGADTWGGFLWLHPSPADAAPLTQTLGRAPERTVRYPLADLVVGYRSVYDVKANWKVMAENYNECYHCGPVHPELSKLVPAFASGGVDLDWESGIEHREGAWTFTMSGTSTRAPFPELDEDEKVRHKGELIYPNLFLSLSAEHVATFVLEPLAVDRTRITCELLFARDEVAGDDFDPSDAAELWEITNQQDWAICELVQRGMTSRAYDQGWYAPMEDESLAITRWLLPKLEGAATT
jgi:glycine betaine catabolism A